MQLTPTATQPAPEGDRERSVTVVGPFNREIDLILRQVCHLRAFHLYLIQMKCSEVTDLTKNQVDFRLMMCYITRICTYGPTTVVVDVDCINCLQIAKLFRSSKLSNKFLASCQQYYKAQFEAVLSQSNFRIP
jgi:hypothetical protein